MSNPLESLIEHPAPLSRLRAGLLDRGGREGIVDAVYTYVDTPIGPVRIAASTHGVVRVGFSHETDVLEKVAAAVGPRILRAESLPGQAATSPAPAEGVLALAVTEIREYFAGVRREFTVPIDLHLGGFRGRVVRELATIEYGRKTSYKDLATQVGNAGAVRAVGSACAHNPIPIFLPCHRVVRTDGTWGNYRGGAEAKTYLLELERAA